MKVLLLLGISFALVGCGSFATLEELEAEAAITGDWSAVERRESIIAKRKARTSDLCGRGYIAVCESHLAELRCSCVQKEAMVGLLYGR